MRILGQLQRVRERFKSEKLFSDQSRISICIFCEINKYLNCLSIALTYRKLCLVATQFQDWYQGKSKSVSLSLATLILSQK